MSLEKWSDDGFLDGLRQMGDPLADRAVEELEARHDLEQVNRLFKTMLANAEPIPDAPEPLRDFLTKTGTCPADLDRQRVERGGRVFLAHALPATVVLLAYSLPSGYSAPPLTRVLSITGDLKRNPFKRLMGVVQLLLNISVAKGFEPGGEALVTAQKMRLLHAGIRRLALEYRGEEFTGKDKVPRKYGVPVNHEDMLATIMGFSWLVIDGLRKLGLPLGDDEAGDFYYVWRVFAVMVGLHPEDRPDSSELVPLTLAEAEAFYNAYQRRHYVDASQNPDGKELSAVNETMMVQLIPGWLRLLGFGAAPRMLMAELLGPKGMAQAGVEPVLGHRLVRWMVHAVLRLTQRELDRGPTFLAAGLGKLMFRDLVRVSWDGEVTWLVPDSVAAANKLA